MRKPSGLVCRPIAPQAMARLEPHFIAQPNQANVALVGPQLINALQAQQGRFATGSERIDAERLQACPQLRICANLSVGFSNFVVAAMPPTSSATSGWHGHGESADCRR